MYMRYLDAFLCTFKDTILKTNIQDKSVCCYFASSEKNYLELTGRLHLTVNANKNHNTCIILLLTYHNM